MPEFGFLVARASPQLKTATTAPRQPAPATHRREKARAPCGVRAFESLPPFARGRGRLATSYFRTPRLMHYHRGCSVSLPCSEWERVGPLRSDHQRNVGWGLRWSRLSRRGLWGPRVGCGSWFLIGPIGRICPIGLMGDRGSHFWSKNRSGR